MNKRLEKTIFKKRLFIMEVLVVVLLMLIIQCSVFINSVNAETVTGSDVEVSLSFDSETGVLTFSGSGEISKKWMESINKDNVKKVVIKDGITRIGEDAFQLCYQLIEIQIPNSVSQIGRNAFIYCNKLEKIELGNIEKIEPQTFQNCENLKCIIIPNSVNTISDNAFSHCKNLESVTIEEGVKNIGGYAFVDCKKLKNIKIPKSIEYIHPVAFSGCNELESIEVEDSNQQYTSENGLLYSKDMTELIYYPEGKKEKLYVVPESVTKIKNGQDIFENGNINLNKIVVPNNVTNIEKWRFSNE